MIRVTLTAATEQLSELIEKALADEPVYILVDDQRAIMLVPAHMKGKRREAGSAKGQFWMSDDFDEPLEDFKEYME